MMTTMMTLVANLLQPILLLLMGTTNTQAKDGTRRLPAIVQPLLLLLSKIDIGVVQDKDVLTDHLSSMMTLVAILLQLILLLLIYHDRFCSCSCCS